MDKKLLMVRTLGFFIAKKRRKNATLGKEDFFAPSDYHVFLADDEPVVQAAAEAFEDAVGCAPLPLSDIDLDQIQYDDIVEQIFDEGVSYASLSLKVTLPPSAPAVSAPPAYFENYVASFGDGGDARTHLDVAATIGRIGQLLADPRNVAQRVNGLVVGRVQSGKTRNYVGLMLKAASEGWNLLLVLTSANTQLADQTESRIVRDFENRARAHSAVRLTLREGGLPDRPSMIEAGNGSFYWGVAMKERSNLERLLKWLHKYRDLVPRMNVLVVDDEADNATPDSALGRQGGSRLSADEVADLIETAADSDAYRETAVWMRGVQEKLQSVLDAKERGEESAETRAVDALAGILEITATSMGDVIGAHREILGIDGAALEQNIRNFFISPEAKEIGRNDCFHKFLDSVLEIARDRSAINRRICELVGLAQESGEAVHPFARCAYVAYTATPYACILNERPGKSPLYADFIQSLDVSPQYFGLERIFGTDAGTEAPAMNIVRPVEPEEKEFVLEPLQKIKSAKVSPKAVLKTKIGPDLSVRCEKPSYGGAWSSMREAVAWTFCAAAARRLDRAAMDSDGRESIENRWTTMLVNISQLQKSHRETEKHLKEYVKLRCADPASAEEFVAECGRTWEALRAEFPKAAFDAACNGGDPRYGEIADYPAWAEVEPHVRFFVGNWRDEQNVHVISINSSAPANNRPQDRYNQVGPFENTLLEDHLWIVCGGNTISRGLTLHGLVASYFDRVRKTVAVDTMTQMGRWFGYRKGYELLPRIWMLPGTVVEMKRTAYVERAMHESIARNFENNFSPSDPDHYQEVYSWGRRLSGRDAAQTRLTGALGTVSTTNTLPGAPAAALALWDSARAFVAQMGARLPRPASDFPLYGNYPLWKDVDKSFVRDFVSRVRPLYPDASGLMLETLLRKIDDPPPQSSDLWYVAIGEPSTGAGALHDLATGVGETLRVKAGVSQNARLDGGAVRNANIRNYLAFYSMIPTRFLSLVDAECLRENARAVARYLEARRDAATGALPPAVESALAPFPQPETERRLVALADAMRDEGGRRLMPPAVHDCLPEGLRNRSSADYRERVYARYYAETGEEKRPVLQLYLVTPPAGLDTGGAPLVSLSFYWPDLPPDSFHIVTVG